MELVSCAGVSEDLLIRSTLSSFLLFRFSFMRWSFEGLVVNEFVGQGANDVDDVDDDVTMMMLR